MDYCVVYNKAHDGLAVFDHKPKGSASLAAIVSAFVPTWLTSLVFIAIFVLIRRRFPNIYVPLTFMGTIPERHRTPSASRAFLSWLHTMRKLSDKFVLYHQSLDTYLFLRFLKTVIFICVVGGLLTWSILIPINAAGGGSSSELDRISIGNVDETRFLYAHAIIACVFFGFVLFTVARERLWLVGLRQAWSLAKPNAERLSSRTVLFLSAPENALDEGNMGTYFGSEAVRIWPVTEADALEALVSDRNSMVEQLEAAEMSLIRNANRKARNYLKWNDRSNDAQLTYDELPDELKRSSRPTRYLKLPGLGRKVDAIEWLREQIKNQEAKIEEARQLYEAKNSQSDAAVFVEFTSLGEAQRACQQVASADVLALTPRYAGVSPSEVVWENLPIPHARRISQEGIAIAIITATIVFWSIPSGFVGLVSNIAYLAENVEWLGFLRGLPDPVIGILSGLIPPLLTSMLSSYVPNIFRYIFKSCGGPTTTVNELMVQKWYYVFQVTQVFLVAAVFSGAATVASELLERARDPGSIPELLARQLPKASNFYLTYFIIQGTTSAADNLLNYSDLIKYLLLDFFDKTPRQKFSRYTDLKGIAWGKVFPKFANFAIIAIAYSCIAPLVLGFAAAGLALYYFSYRYNFLFVVQPKTDTKGQAYALALQHLLAGVYIGQLALVGLFALRQATGPTVIVAVLFIATIIYNALMNRYLTPLEQFLPTELVRAAEADQESAPLLRSDDDVEAQAESHIQRLGRCAHVPPGLAQHAFGPLASVFEPRVFASYEAMRSWLRKGDYHGIVDDSPEYKEEDLRKAYLNPALTTPTPPIWLARDPIGFSGNEVRENEEYGLKASDQGAWLDSSGKVRWNTGDFSKVPIWKEKVKY
ncbi:hypothetical protein DL766_007898 [Monosporascus sp. MC13-8B]|uniref:CSC1/OSCA1-like 7TM region domain-containing protein n=1 Tax=Monosporascus cannonballus TaxID=155416 RepID=A0ABY0H162_9PEZI|nr:hypothetical protein DL762_006726 [Monosporascus cannonballus]RYO95769.1 hypothetical protein DL763_003549 [Monosporascus cannonballus]RYP21624.1 hypothetical protein DL766_007898 [Monosporascus sp. MC13-8B]